MRNTTRKPYAYPKPTSIAKIIKAGYSYLPSFKQTATAADIGLSAYSAYKAFGWSDPIYGRSFRRPWKGLYYTGRVLKGLRYWPKTRKKYAYRKRTYSTYRTQTRSKVAQYAQRNRYRHFPSNYSRRNYRYRKYRYRRYRKKYPYYNKYWKNQWLRKRNYYNYAY